MRKNKLLFMFIFLVCLIPTIVDGATLVMTDYEVTIRKGPGTNYGSYGVTGPTGSEYTLRKTDLTRTEQGCSSGYWYNINYNNNSAYICSSFAIIKNDTPIVISEEAKNQCQADLKAKGFPETYWNSLCYLKAKYPNWEFNSIYTGYDFASIVAKESCKNSIYNSATNQNKGYIDSSCGGSRDSGYTSASTTAVAYYMNPLNFLDEKNIFMFESNYNNSNISSYDTIARNIVTPGTYFVQFMPYLYGQITNAASTGMSPAAIATRIRQEMGSGNLGYTRAPDNTALYSCLSGNYTTRSGKKHSDGSSLDNYYNFYNVGAYDGSDITLYALRYAKNHGWGGTGNQQNDRQTAVTQGAKWIYDNYTNAGQQTIYFNKFNVNPASTRAVTNHQYMTSVDAAVSEASILYNGYKNANALNQKIKFYIPVFSNQAAAINNTPGGATGDTNNENTNMAPTTMVVSAGFSLSGNIMSGIKGDTSIGDFKGRIQSQGGTVTVFSGSSQVSDGLIGTGMTVKVESSTGTAEFTAVVKGDPSGDGKVNALDLLQIQKYILGQKKLDGVYHTASDTSGDGKVDTIDLLQIQKKILGQKEL